jgi:hypothetical protein
MYGDTLSVWCDDRLNNGHVSHGRHPDIGDIEENSYVFKDCLGWNHMKILAMRVGRVYNSEKMCFTDYPGTRNAGT